MKFFTEIEIPESPAKIEYNSGILMLGSCFAENIGLKLSQLKFKVDLNPFGILYNPDSIAGSLEILVEKRLFTPSDLFFADGVWNSFSHHGRFAAGDLDETLRLINSRIIAGSENLKNAGFLFLTFGTAWVYQLIESGLVVSNCHKVPAVKFKRFRLEVDEVVEKTTGIISKIQEINPGLKVIFTVSPIRHWKDGAVENHVSKSTLILAVDRIVKNNPSCGYFPSYEIVMDELRDYRFYAEDMLHISDAALNHIWHKFEKTYISIESQQILAAVRKILDAAAHRPFNKNTPDYKNFALKSIKEAESLQTKYPFLNLKPEVDFFKEQIDILRVNIE